MNTAIDLNCDMGESYGAYTIGGDAGVVAYITSANIACGFHASDPMVMDRTVRLCRDNNVAPGAHPGFPDRVGFGRRFMDLTAEELINDVIYQVGALRGFLARYELPLQHVKLHGALYNYVATREELILRIAGALQKPFDNPVFLTRGTTRTTKLLEKCRREGIRLALEPFRTGATPMPESCQSPRDPGRFQRTPERLPTAVAMATRKAWKASAPLAGNDIQYPSLHGDNKESMRRRADTLPSMNRSKYTP